MKKMMKFAALLLAAVLALAVLAGCAGKAEPEPSFTLPDGLVAPTLTPAPDGAGE